MTERDLYLIALKKESAVERAGFLDQACAGDHALRRRVEVLLQAQGEPTRFPQPYAASPEMGEVETSCPNPELAATVTVETSPVAAEPATRIGPYKLIRKLGEGGMGAVYLAEQEQPVRRKVAVKVIRPGLNNAQVLARFEAERQSLALMDHVNIAKVLDVGATENRRPYFVMEYVQGEPLTRYCEEHKLSIRERLDLFVMVCQGIQHAHQKGVIHRDLKPSNILVTLYENKPIPKVIDFGLAKATERSFGDESLTEYGTVLGTLDYMSPEQAEGNARGVDTRSDVYSLGVLLYELLTGTPPLERSRLQNAGITALLRMIKEEEPPRPSARLMEPGQPLTKIAEQRRTEPARLVKQLRGELDWIALKALEKDRNRRYETASGLAQEVQRYLADEPVEACPPSVRYRLGKFARKHRTLLATATGIAALVVLGIAGLIAGLVQVNEARVKEKKSQVRTMASLRGTFQIIRELLSNRQHLNDRELGYLKQALKEFEGFAAEQGNTADVRELQAEGEFNAALIRALLNQSTEAEAGYGRAIALYSKLAEEFPSNTLYQESLANGYKQLGLLQRSQSKLPEAEKSLRQAVALHQTLADRFPNEQERQLRLAESYKNLGIVLYDRSKLEEASSYLDKSVTLLDTLTADDPDNDSYRSELAKYYLNRGLVYHKLNQLVEAQKSNEKAVRLLEALIKEAPRNPEYRIDLANCLMGQGILLTEQRKPKEATVAYQKAIANLFLLAQQFPLFPDYRFQLANAYSDFGAFLSDNGETQAAEKNYSNAINLGESLVAQYPNVPDYRIKLAAYYGNFANLVRDQNKPSAALEIYGKALATLEGLEPQSCTAEVFRIRLNAYWDRALTQARLNKHVEEQEDWQQALNAAEEMLKAQPPGPAAASDHYFAARAYSLASAAFKDNARLQEQYSARSLGLLSQAKTLGYFQEPSNVEQLKREMDFAPLRQEPAFQKFVAEL